MNWLVGDEMNKNPVSGQFLIATLAPRDGYPSDQPETATMFVLKQAETRATAVMEPMSHTDNLGGKCKFCTLSTWKSAVPWHQPRDRRR